MAGADGGGAGRVVLRGSLGDGRTWQVRVHGAADNLGTTLEVHDGDRLVRASGFGGPALPAGRRMNPWWGSSPGTPEFVMARTDPGVDRVRVVPVDGEPRNVELTAVAAPFGLRFAAAALRPGEGFAALEAYCGGELVESWPGARRPTRPPH